VPWQPLSISKQWSGNYILKLSPGRRPWKLLLLYRHLLTVSPSKYTNKSLDPKVARVSYVYPSAPFYIIIYKYQGKNVSGFIIIKEVQLKSTYISSIIYIYQAFAITCSHSLRRKQDHSYHCNVAYMFSHHFRWKQDCSHSNALAYTILQNLSQQRCQDMEGDFLTLIRNFLLGIWNMEEKSWFMQPHHLVVDQQLCLCGSILTWSQ